MPKNQFGRQIGQMNLYPDYAQIAKDEGVLAKSVPINQCFGQLPAKQP